MDCEQRKNRSTATTDFFTVQWLKYEGLLYSAVHTMLINFTEVLPKNSCGFVLLLKIFLCHQRILRRGLFLCHRNRELAFLIPLSGAVC